MLTTAAISAAEVRSVQDGALSDVREDGRGLLQRRPVHIQNTHAGGHAVEEGSYNGSSVTLRVGTSTTVLAAASPSVVEVPTGPAASAGTQQTRPSARGEDEEDVGHGPLYITIDAAPAVVDHYASAIGGRSGQYRRTHLAHVALTIRNLFGAECVAVEERQSGVAEAQPVADEPVGALEPGAEREEGPEAAVAGAEAAETGTGGTGLARPQSPPTGYPSRDLYIGSGYAFRIDVDVHIQQAAGGNLLSCVALAVHAALRSVRLPSVTLHEAASGVSVEVDRGRPFHRVVDWSQLPVLATLLISPTRHYLVDPTLREELALPQQLHVAASRDGHVCYARYCHYPTRSSGGGKLLLSAGHDAAATHAASVEGGRRVAALGEAADPSALHAAQFELHPSDFIAAVGDAVHICEAMIADCDEELRRALA